MNPQNRQLRFRIMLCFALVYVLWGSTYLAIRISVEHIPPALMGATRFLISGPLMLVACRLMGRSITLTASALWRVALIGVLLLTTGNVVVAWAEQYVPSGLTALIVAAVPIWVAIIEAWVLKSERLSRRGLFGLALGLGGLMVLLWPRLTASTAMGHMQLLGAMALLLASLSWATGSILSRRWDLGISPLSASAWEMTFAGLVNLLIALALGDQHRVVWTSRGVIAVAYLVVCGSWIGFSAFIWLLEHVPTAKVSTYAYVNPVVAVFLGWLVLHEQIDVYIAVGTAIIVAAVVLVTRSKMQKLGGEIQAAV